MLASGSKNVANNQDCVTISRDSFLESLCNNNNNNNNIAGPEVDKTVGKFFNNQLKRDFLRLKSAIIQIVSLVSY